MRPAKAASPPCAAGQIRPWSRAEAVIAASSTPETPRMDPSRVSSPSAVKPSIASSATTPMATNRPKAIGRSKWLPSFNRSAGDKFTVMRRGGSARPMAASAARTRSRDSATALSGRPTTVNAGRPLIICTCTSTATASTPWKATVLT